MTDTWMGDDFFHQGAFRLSYGFEYASDLELSKDQSIPSPISHWDTYDWYLELGPLANADAKYFHGRVPTWLAFTQHPSYDAYWQARAVERDLKSPSVPTLTVGGWWDQEDRWGPLATYKALEPGDTKHWNFLVMGPWNHGGWRNQARAMPVVDPGTADAFLRDVEAPWFAYWLHDKGSMSEPTAYLYDAGAKQWRSFDTWPPKSGASDRKIYLHVERHAVVRRAEVGERRSTTSSSPIPRTRCRIGRARSSRRTTRAARAGARGRRRTSASCRVGPTCSRWESAPLDEDVTIAGDVVAHIVASTTGQDADWVVKLIDVFPDSVPSHWDWGGYQLMVAHEIMRGRYREGFTTPKPIPAEHAAAIHGRPAPAELHVREGPPDDGAGAEHAGSRSTTGTRRRGCRTSSRRRRATSRRRRTACGTRRSRRRTSR